ncbi:MAG: chemotaxis protein CheW [Treponemataceae bacterium]|nr:chemotaxis protein CheW [Treponemataceae bacterium]
MESVAEKDIGMQTVNEEIAEERKEKLANIDFKMVAFSLAGRDYAIDIMKVKEIAKAGRFTYVPNTSPFVLGVYNLRGEIIPIIDLRLFFGIKVPERKGDEIENVIIVGVGEQIFGVVIDAIDKVVGIQKSSIQPPHPLFGGISIKYISGVVESNGHLYILLDIDRIFGARDSGKNEIDMLNRQAAQAVADTKKLVAETAADSNPKLETEYKFLVDNLKSLRKFSVTGVNEAWVRSRLIEWTKERGQNKIQLVDEKDADAFLAPFYSPCNGVFWTEQYAAEILKILPDNKAKQIFVWNPGCGKGYETYSLACVLKKRYPDAKIRIYAHDVDLLNVSNAPLLTVPAEAANAASWLKPYLTTTSGGGYTFNQEIKDIIMFEYHDCMNNNSMQPVDIIFARDIISLLPEEFQVSFINDFSEKLKGNGCIFVGANETLPDTAKWHAKKVGSVTIFSK